MNLVIDSSTGGGVNLFWYMRAGDGVIWLVNHCHVPKQIHDSSSVDTYISRVINKSSNK